EATLAEDARRHGRRHRDGASSTQPWDRGHAPDEPIHGGCTACERPVLQPHDLPVADDLSAAEVVFAWRRARGRGLVSRQRDAVGVLDTNQLLADRLMDVLA